MAPSRAEPQVSEAPVPVALTEEVVLARYRTLCRALAPRRNRAPGERVAAGDDVLLDVLGFANGRLMAFSARSEWWTEVAANPRFPGLLESLVGLNVGKTHAVELTLPGDHPVEALRGVAAHFVVKLTAAREVATLDEQSSDFFAVLARGSTRDEVMAQLRRELAAEREAQAQRERQGEALREWSRRARVEVPRSLVDEELRRCWSEVEHPVLVRLGLAPEQMREALEGWLDDGATRLEAEHRVRLQQGLRAVAMSERLKGVCAEAQVLSEGLSSRARVAPEATGHRGSEPWFEGRLLYA
ncbi:peptidylprolyl isomerase [Myxococcus stipitatus]|uniref:peptidylprolyl isomerase n=1 Tax=Myxococcus stipitatus TaxID=83455 RepID=UPI00118617B2|nr:peptidylprolyl isomerase [Myxococcus stipitatus]